MRRSCPHEPPLADSAVPPRTGLAEPRRSLKTWILAVLAWLFARVALFVDRWIIAWHRLPGLPGLMVILGIRTWMRMKDENLFAPVGLEGAGAPAGCGASAGARSADGACNDEAVTAMGKARTAFGRNVPSKAARVDRDKLLVPNPREISNKLLARESFQKAGNLNLLAAAWIQFMVHDWFSHGRNIEKDPIEVPIEMAEDTWPNPMRVRRTRPGPPQPADMPPVFVNTETHWWDASQIYGSSLPKQKRLRAGGHGKLKLNDRGLLPGDECALGSRDQLEGLELTGVNANWWIGLSLLHTLFVREHNAICDHLRARYPAWCDDALFEHARLINAALLAKIHTLDWTPAILGHPAVKIGMNGNWWGLATERVHRLLGRVSTNDVLSGIPGSPMDHHGVAFSMTEEFVAVYRMHPLLPDDLTFWSAAAADGSGKVWECQLPDVVGRKTRSVLDKLDIADVAYSFGRMHAGKIALGNYPTTLRRIEKDGALIDLATVDILRDRERGIPRYNEFRKRVHRRPIKSFNELDPAWAGRLCEAYQGKVDDIDLMIGLFAETPPKGFGFSDTAFRIFLLMASRRLKSDRFFTDDYGPEVYTPEGIAWIEDNDMRTVLRRHFEGRGYARLEGAIRQSPNAFFTWA
jgi:hypothetical protein